MVNFDFRTGFMKTATAVCAVAGILCLTVSLWFGLTQKVVIKADTGENSEEEITESEPLVRTALWTIDTEAKNGSSLITMKFPDDVTEDSISISDRYDISELDITFKTEEAGFFASNRPSGSFDHVEKAEGYFDGSDVVVRFFLTEPCVYESLCDGSEIKLVLEPVSEIEVPIVVADARHGGSQQGTVVGDTAEKDILLEIATTLEKSAKDKPYKVIALRNSDVYLDTEDRITTIGVLGADCYLGLELSTDTENVKNFGMTAVYNDGYYRKGIQNAEFSSMILKNACTYTSDRALGLMTPSEENVILKTLDIPGTVLYAGYITNEEELGLLKSSEYISKLCGGILAGLDEMYAEGGFQ